MAKCELCSEGYITNNGFHRPTDEHNDYIFHDKDGWFLNVYCHGCGDYETTPIKYCPICGRKLKNEEEEE